MKKAGILLLFLIICFLPVSLFALSVTVRTETATKEMFSVSCSSTVATQVLDENTVRVAWTVSNPSSSYSMYISTYTITLSEALTVGKAWHKIDPAVNGTNYGEETNPYLGAIYIIVPSGTTTISGEERVR